MKYIKKFETIYTNNHLPKDLGLKIGDFVFIKRGKSYLNKNQKIIWKIESYDQGSDLWEISSKYFEDFTLYYSKKDLRKATKQEINDYLITLDAEKYNL